MSGINRERLRTLLAERDVTPRALSLAVGANETLIRDILSGRSRNPRSDTVVAIAEELGVPVEELVLAADASSGRTEGSATARKRPVPAKVAGGKLQPFVHGRPTGPIAKGVRDIPLLGEVRAGAWIEAMDQVVRGYVSVPDLPEYRRSDMFALLVVGRSMNEFYPDGSKLICLRVPPEEVRENDHVIIQRHRAGFVETTVKEIVLDEDGPVFLPRSTDPEHQQPFRLPATEDTQEGASIIGVVIDHIPPRRPRSGSAIWLTEHRSKE